MTDTRPIFELVPLDVADGVCLQLHGELDLAQKGVVARAVGYLRPPARTLTLDLANLQFCDSAGLRVLVHVRDAAMAAGWQFQIIQVQQQTRRVIDVTGLSEYLQIRDRLSSSFA